MLQVQHILEFMYIPRTLIIVQRVSLHGIRKEDATKVYNFRTLRDQDPSLGIVISVRLAIQRPNRMPIMIHDHNNPFSFIEQLRSLPLPLLLSNESFGVPFRRGA